MNKNRVLGKGLSALIQGADLKGMTERRSGADARPSSGAPGRTSASTPTSHVNYLTTTS